MMRFLPALAVAALVAGCAPNAPVDMAAGGSQCFWASAVNNYRAAGDRAVNLRVGVGDIYRLDLIGPCPDIDWSQKIGIESHGGGHICTGLDATIISPSSIGPQRCAVRSVRKLTPEEIAALPASEMP